MSSHCRQKGLKNVEKNVRKMSKKGLKAQFSDINLGKCRRNVRQMSHTHTNTHTHTHTIFGHTHTIFGHFWGQFLPFRSMLLFGDPVQGSPVTIEGAQRKIAFHPSRKRKISLKFFLHEVFLSPTGHSGTLVSEDFLGTHSS